jgi:hypothetical protein
VRCEYSGSTKITTGKHTHANGKTVQSPGKHTRDFLNMGRQSANGNTQTESVGNTWKQDVGIGIPMENTA